MNITEVKKAILVIDMPKACCKCPFFHSDFDIKRGACRANNTELTKDNFYFQKPDECPLKPLVEAIPIEWIVDWLTRQQIPATHTCDDYYAVEMMLDDWEKENEID